MCKKMPEIRILMMLPGIYLSFRIIVPPIEMVQSDFCFLGNNGCFSGTEKISDGFP